jgi:hypothetical protein
MSRKSAATGWIDVDVGVEIGVDINVIGVIN